jgi:tetratricopeptide (TPR) repeat protein
MTRSPAKDGALFGRRIALTGRFASMKREEALTFLEMVGAFHDRIPVPETDFLVVGEASRLLTEDGHPTASLAAARNLQETGAEIEILSETQFLALLGLDELLRLYTSQQLGRILKVPAREIASWVRRGLVRPVKVVNRLFYFDFGQVASAKFLVDLIRSGVPISRIRENLRDMESWYPGVGKSLVQLGVMEQYGRLLIRLEDGSLADSRGQLQLEFGEGAARGDPGASGARELRHPDVLRLPIPAVPRGGGSARGDGPGDEDGSARASPFGESWFDAGLSFEEAGWLEDAAAAYLKALAVDGPSAELAFNLGNVLYGLGRKEESVQRFLQAVELEPAFIESWNNLANALFEIDRPEEAVRALRKALAVDPYYADAHYNLAEVLHHLGRLAEAADHWRAYLEQDPASEWSEHVRDRLKRLEEDLP